MLTGLSQSSSFFTLPCRGRVGERSEPGWGPSSREIGACGTAPPRRACASLRRGVPPLRGPDFCHRRRARLPSHLARRPRRNPRARGTPGSRWTHGPWRLAAPRRPGREPGQCPGLTGRGSDARRGAADRKSTEPSASRARCLIGLLRRTPGGLTFQAPCPFYRVQRLPTAVGTEQHLAVGSAVRRCIRRSTGDARLAHRDPAAWAAARGVANPPRGHRPDRPGCPRNRPWRPWQRISAALQPSPHLSALERALGWDEVGGI